MNLYFSPLEDFIAKHFSKILLGVFLAVLLALFILGFTIAQISLLIIVATIVFYTIQRGAKTTKIEVGWFTKAVLSVIIAFGLVGIVIGNGVLFTLGMALCCLILVITTFYDFLDEKITPTQAATIIGGVGIFLFTVAIFLNSMPFFLVEGTDHCISYDLNFMESSYHVDINDLRARNYGESAGFVQIVTATNKEISCKDCFPPEYPKLPYAKLPVDIRQESIQLTTVQLEIPQTMKSFWFTQQMRQRDFATPFISERAIPVRSCQCEINLDSNKANCASRPQGFTDFFVFTTLFR